MITPVMCDRILFYADRQRSRRYKRIDLLNALNIAKNACVLDRYDNIKKESGYSFESVERIREELYTILKNAPAIPTIGGNTTQPADFMLEIVMYVVINAKKVLSSVATYEENDLTTNVYASPSDDEPVHRKTATGFRHQWAGGLLTTTDLWYLCPSIDLDWSEVNLGLGTTLILNTKYYVNIGPVTWNGQTFQQGQSFIANVAGQTITLGGAVNVIVDCDLPEIIHEEIAKVAASILMGTFENYQKSARIEAEVKRS